MDIDLMTDKPKSVCRCGHTGDGQNSDHEATVQGLGQGHGACRVSGCGCDKFSWKGFTKEFEAKLKIRQN